MTRASLPPLREYYVYVTDRCNCSCKHCWIVPEPGAHPRKSDATHFISPQILEAAILEGLPLGLTTIKWTGGEPTIHPDFPALLQVQKKHGLSGRLETNAMEVTPELAQSLREAGVSLVSVSMDSSVPEIHDSIRGVKGAHCRTLAGLRNLVDAGFRPQIIMSLMAENVHDLEGLLDFAERIGAGSVKLNIIQPTLRGESLHSSGLALTVTELLDINLRLEQELRSRYSMPIHMDVPIAFRPLNQIMSGSGRSVCGIKTILGLLADGSYALCGIGENLPEMVFGQAGNEELARIWREHPVVLQIRNDLPDRLQGICSRCLMKSLCLGACVAQNYYRLHDLMSAFWFCEVADEEDLFPPTRLALQG